MQGRLHPGVASHSHDHAAELLHLGSPTALEVVDHARETVGLWCEQAPQVRFLVTSRALLGTKGEHEYGLEPLSKPTLEHVDSMSFEEIQEIESVQLFVHRAQEVRPQFELTAANATAVAQVCAAVEGMPLSVELAAA